MADTEEKKNKPENSDFKQQRLKAWQPILTPTYVILTFAAVGVVFLIIGVLVLVASEAVVEITSDDYKNLAPTSSTCVKGENSDERSCLVTVSMEITADMKQPIYMYYQLSNFYQNHRRYVKSRSDTQLRNDDLYTVDSLCEPLAKRSCTPQAPNNVTGDCAVYPCGLIAWSVFNDTFYQSDFGSFNATADCPYITSCVQKMPNGGSAGVGVPWDNSDIAWASDKDQKFKRNDNPNPYQFKTSAPGSGDTTAMPYDSYKYFTCAANIAGDNKPYPDSLTVCTNADTSTARFADVSNEEFIVWMRTSGLPEFRKLHRVIRSDLKKGDVLTFTVNNVFPVDSFDGGKKIVLSTTEWIGGKNQFLGWAYIVVAILCLLLAIAFGIKQALTPREPTTSAELEGSIKAT